MFATGLFKVFNYQSINSNLELKKKIWMNPCLEGPTFQASSNCGPVQYSTSQIETTLHKEKLQYQRRMLF